MKKFLSILKKNSDKKEDSVQVKLNHMFYKYFNLKLQYKLGKLKQVHLLKKIRYEIAHIKFFASKNKDRIK